MHPVLYLNSNSGTKKFGISVILNYSDSTQDSTQLPVLLEFPFILMAVAGLAGTGPSGCGYLYKQTQGFFWLAISGEKCFILVT